MFNQPRDVNEWSDYFLLIYGERNKPRPWTALTHSLAARLLTMKSPKYIVRHDAFVQHFSVSMGWFFGIYNKLRLAGKGHGVLDLGRILINEYPHACPACGQRECLGDTCPYTSDLRKKQRQINVQRARTVLASTPSAARPTLHDWASCSNAIYKKNSQRPVEWLGNKVGEEWVELDDAIEEMRHSKSRAVLLDVYEELADVFSWTCVLGARVLRQHMDDHTCPENHRSLDDLLWTVYRTGCPKCSDEHPNSLPCTCPTATATIETLPLFEMTPQVASIPSPGVGSPTIQVSPSITVHAGSATATAIATSHSTNDLWLDLYRHASEDRAASPQLYQAVQTLEHSLRQPAPDTKVVQLQAEQVINAAPNKERGRVYAQLLKTLLIHVAAHLVASPISHQLQEVAKDLPQYVDTVAQWIP